jgi:hypothetical protein
MMSVLSVQERLLELGAPLPVQVVCPWRTVLDGAFQETRVVQVQVPAGITTVSPATAVFIAACTSFALHVDAVRVAARPAAPESAKASRINNNLAMVRIDAPFPWEVPSRGQKRTLDESGNDPVLTSRVI